MPTFSKRIAALALGGCLASGGAFAADLPETKLKFVGFVSNLVLHTDLEVPFFGKTLPEMSGGKVTVDLKPQDTLGLKGSELLRLLKNGSLEYVAGNITYMAPDSPKFEGLDLAGLTLTVDKAREVTEAYRPVLNDLTQKLWNSRILAFAANPPQVFWCRESIGGIGDLSGKKIRVFNQTLADFVTGLGGTTVNIPFVDVIPALQRGVADCAVTGTLSGNSAKWPEVTKSIYPMPVGWSIAFWAVNLDVWNGYTPEVRDFLTKAFVRFEDEAWKLSQMQADQGMNCNLGKDPCTLGNKANMQLVPLGATDMDAHARILQEHVIKRWAERCGVECAKEWNETIGKVVGMKAPTG